MENQPFRGLITTDVNKAHVILTGIPYDEGCSCGSGAHLAPKTIRDLSSFLPPLSKDGIELSAIQMFDSGDIKKVDKNYFEQIEMESLKRFQTGKFPIFLGGRSLHWYSITTCFLSLLSRKREIPGHYSFRCPS